jgi:hypothetical protein
VGERRSRICKVGGGKLVLYQVVRWLGFRGMPKSAWGGGCGSDLLVVPNVAFTQLSFFLT